MIVSLSTHLIFVTIYLEAFTSRKGNSFFQNGMFKMKKKIVSFRCPTFITFITKDTSFPTHLISHCTIYCTVLPLRVCIVSPAVTERETIGSKGFYGFGMVMG
jgi:hypothetical protein